LALGLLIGGCCWRKAPASLGLALSLVIRDLTHLFTSLFSHTKHHAGKHHQGVRPLYLHEPTSPRDIPQSAIVGLGGCVNSPARTHVKTPPMTQTPSRGPTPTTDPTTTTTQHTQTSGHICIQTRSKGHHQLVVGIKLNTSSLSSLRVLQYIEVWLYLQWSVH
jgi:hypothetical protein